MDLVPSGLARQTRVRIDGGEPQSCLHNCQIAFPALVYFETYKQPATSVRCDFDESVTSLAELTPMLCGRLTIARLKLTVWDELFSNETRIVGSPRREILRFGLFVVIYLMMCKGI